MLLDLGAMERAIRNTEINGLHWGASNLIPVADGISKLQIHLTIQDSLVSADNIEVCTFPMPTLVLHFFHCIFYSLSPCFSHRRL